MTEPLPYHSPAPALPFPDRRAYVMAAGIILILAGAMAGCGVLTTPLALVVPQQPGQMKIGVGQIVSAMLLYATLSTALVWLGIGAVMKRRWSRPLILILATHWLLAGIIVLVSSIVMFPLTRDTLAEVPNLPPGFMAGMLIAGIALSTVFLIILPSIILFLVKSDAARLTLAHFDPHERWTDRCPIKLLGLSMTLFLAAILFAITATYAMFPLGGVLLTGPAAIAVSLLIGIVLAIAGYWVYRRQIRGWWLGLAGIVLPSLAMIPSMLIVPVTDIYRHYGMPEEQLEVIADHATLIRGTSIGFLVLLCVTFTIYMLRLLPELRAASTHPREDNHSPV